MLKTLLLAASLFAATVQAAAPQQMNLVYDLYRNGHKLGQVTDTFTRNGSRYTLTSETRANGPLKFLWPGSIRLESTGDVTREGLRPTQFQHARSDAPHKLATARLDWKQRSIAYHYKGESWQVNGLQNGAQDQLSQLYQFMFAPGLPADYSLQVVSGRDLNDYRYARSDGGSIQTPLGELATQQYQRITQKPDEKTITVWVAPARNNLPVQIRVSEDGVTLEQRLVRASIKA
ncbi:MAG: DUF3108 domain-containing protein [Thiobacillus sp.]|nr:DUF3108 domain-containing protein [Thiobacillus sp.]MDP2057536.1 DUF3108 domain-containing protein [Thiobacillus sp.]